MNDKLDDTQKQSLRDTGLRFRIEEPKYSVFYAEWGIFKNSFIFHNWKQQFRITEEEEIYVKEGFDSYQDDKQTTL